MKKVRVLIIALILIIAGIFFSFVNAEELDSNQDAKKTLQLKFSLR